MKNRVWSTKEIRAFWANMRRLAKRIGMDEKELAYDMINHFFGKGRTRELTRDEFVVLKNRVEELVWDRDGKLTEPQEKKIVAMAKELEMSDEYLRNFCRKVTGVDHPQWLSWQQARVLIAALTKKKRYAKCTK